MNRHLLRLPRAHCDILCCDLLQGLSVNVLNLYGEYVAISGQFSDLLWVIKGARNVLKI